MDKHSIIDFLGFVIVKAFSLLLCCIPLRISLWLGRRGGDIVYLLYSKRRAIAYSNLKSAFPEKSSCELKKINRAHFQNLAMSVIELLKAPVIGKKYLDKYITIKGSDVLKQAIDRGRGVILLTAHFGNWEIAPLVVTANGYRMSVFAREQKYTRLNSLLNRYREMIGCKVVAKGFSVRGIIKTLRSSGIVGMLADQDAGPNGVFVNFLGRPASTAEGPLSFSLKTGAVILPSFIRRAGFDRHIAEIGEMAEPDLQKITALLEDKVKTYPEQWLWSHKRWKSTTKRTVLVLSDGKAGHLNQAVAVAEMVKDALRLKLAARGINEEPIVKVELVEVKFKSRFMKSLLDLCSLFATMRCQGCLKCLRFFLEKESFEKIKNKYADIVISCGASLVGMNIFLKHENNAKGIVIMKPGLGRDRKLDLVILPRHDVPLTLTLSPEGRGNNLNLLSPLGRGKGDGVLITEAAPNRIRQEQATNNGIGLLIGGDAKNFRLFKDDVDKVVDGLSKIAREMDRDIFASTSRRTSLEIDVSLKEKLTNNERCAMLVIANEKNIEGVVPKIFSQSEVVIVSPDSISMISESASSGKHTVVFRITNDACPPTCPPKLQRRRKPLRRRKRPHTKQIITLRCLVRGRRTTKHSRAITNLEEKGYIKTAAPDEIYDVIKQLLAEKPPVKRLDDRKKIVERLKAIV